MASITKEEILVMGVVLGICLKKKRRRPRRMWCKKWLTERESYSHVLLLKELEASAPDDFFNYLRMDVQTFYTLLDLIGPEIQKKNTVMREAVSAKERLAVTLRYMATGRNYADLKFSSIISPQALSKIIPETCWAFYRKLKNEYLKVSTFIL
jgi:hypothetical protein